LVWFQQKPPITNVKTNEIPEMVLCIKCYAEGNYPTVLSANDFNKCDLLGKLNPSASGDANGGPARSNWTSEETAKLLELISKNQDNWNGKNF
jgi:hypothetical protein